MAGGSVLTGSLTVARRSDGSGGDLHVDGALTLTRGSERVNVLSLTAACARHRQEAASAVWVIDHRLGTCAPLVKIFVGGREVRASIDYAGATSDRIEVYFAVPCAGEAVLFAVGRDTV